jgi:hypothetical protein
VIVVVAVRVLVKVPKVHHHVDLTHGGGQAQRAREQE